MVVGECRVQIDGGCCCQCQYRLKAAISHIPGDLGWAACHARRWACYQPDLNVVIVFHIKDKGHGFCECFTKKYRRLI